jgi:hypothetical protein
MRSPMTPYAPRNLAVAMLLSLGPFRPITGQDSSAAPPYYVYMRAGGASATYAYAMYSTGKAVFGIGVLADWRNAYREFAAGAGLNLYSESGNGATVMAAVADASDSRYLELWLFPAVASGRLSFTGFGGLYVPVDQAGVWQYYLDPGALFWRVTGPVAVGASYSGYKIEGLAARHGIGPAVQIVIPHGSAIVEVLRELKNFDDDVRVTLQFTF